MALTRPENTEQPNSTTSKNRDSAVIPEVSTAEKESEKIGTRSSTDGHGASNESDESIGKNNGLPALDCGYAWCISFGTFLASLLVGGLPYCWGIMQDYYEREVFGNSKDVTVKLSAAGTLVAAMIYIFFIPTNIMYNTVGPKVLLCVGTVMISGGLVAAAQATEIWHIYLSMSICSGIGVSIMYNVCFRVTPLWFDKKRNIAFAITGTSQPFAGLILPFFITPLNNSLGAPWTFRILGLIFLVINVIATILIKEKPIDPQLALPKRSSQKKLDYSILLKTNMIVWLVTGPILIAVIYLPYTFIPLYATYIGLSNTQGSTIVSVICGAGVVGRITTGLLADYVGQLNTLIITSVITSLSFLLIWMFAHNIGMLMAFAVIYGLFNGAYPVVAAPVTAAIVGMDRYPLVISLLVTICGIGCVSPTIASSIESVSTLEPFMTYKLIAGCLCIMGALLVLALKLRLSKSIFSKIL